MELQCILQAQGVLNIDNLQLFNNNYIDIYLTLVIASHAAILGGLFFGQNFREINI